MKTGRYILSFKCIAVRTIRQKIHHANFQNFVHSPGKISTKNEEMFYSETNITALLK
jgi:hypothetical protein